MQIKQYDRVRLKDGRTGTIIEVHESDKNVFEIEFPSTDELDWVTITSEDVEQVL